MPGPKMLWQFGEMGYDYSINWCTDGSISNDCRLTPKPIRWDYLTNIRRQRLRGVTAAMIKLKTEFGITQDLAYSHDFEGDVKLLRLVKENVEGLVIANFGVTELTVQPDWPATGTYYSYLSGDTLLVESVTQPLTLQAGEYYVYLTQQLDKPIIAGVADTYANVIDYAVYPNPTSELLTISLNIVNGGPTTVLLINSQGQTVLTEQLPVLSGTNQLTLDVSKVPAGMYYLICKHAEWQITDRILVKDN